jgi:radical SAM-linked protein
LGATSSGEVVDFELKAPMDPTEFLQRLTQELPLELPLYSVEEVPIDSPAATKLLERAEYYLRVGLENPTPTEPDWQAWVNQVLNQTEILWEKTTKSGKVQIVNLREQLYKLDYIHRNCPTDDESLAPMPDLKGTALKVELGEALIRVVGSCRNDGNLLRPEQVVWMVEQAAGQSLQLRHKHRSRLYLANISAP